MTYNFQGYNDPRRRPMLEQLLAKSADVPAVTPAGFPGLGEVAPPPSVPDPLQVVDPNTAPAAQSKLERMLAERNAIANADPSAPVNRLPQGGYSIGAPKKPSRLKQALTGIGEALLVPNPTGDPYKLLGAIGVGAAAGAISPKMMQALTRSQMVDELDHNLATSQHQELANAQVEATQAAPYLKAREIDRQIANDQAVEADRQARMEETRTAREARTRDSAQAAKDRAANLAERKDYHEKLLAKQTQRAHQYHTDTATGDIIAIDPADDSTKVIRKGSRAHSKLSEAQAIWDAAGKQYDNDAVPKFKEADDLRAQADALTSKGVPSEKAKTQAAELNRRAATLEREAEGIASKVRTMQTEGDKLAAEAKAAGAGDDTGDIETQIRAAAAEQGLDPDTAVARWRKRKKR